MPAANARGGTGDDTMKLKALVITALAALTLASTALPAAAFHYQPMPFKVLRPWQITPGTPVELNPQPLPPKEIVRGSYQSR
jgi:hypothetical protein